MKSRLNSPVPKPQILKKAGAVAATVLLLAFLLLDPVRASEASAAGLLLWFHTLVPVLLPFLILSSLLIALDGVSSLMGLLYPILHRIFGCSRDGCFCLVSGFLCGFPTGARITGELVRTRHISVEEGDYLLGFCNNVSPAFLIGFCVTKSLGGLRLPGRPSFWPSASRSFSGFPPAAAAPFPPGRQKKRHPDLKSASKSQMPVS